MRVMLLAAGRGERMGKLTESCPKPLLPIAGKPLLQHHLERLAAAGFHQVVVNAHYRADDIQRFLNRWHAATLEVELVIEPELLETGGGIHNALPLLGEQPFMVINSDVWTDYPLAALAQKGDALVARGDLAYLVLVANPDHNPGGDFALNGQQRIENGGQAMATFSGVSILTPALFEACLPGRFPLGPLLREAVNQSKVGGEFYSGQWVDVGTPQRLQRVEESLKE